MTHWDDNVWKFFSSNIITYSLKWTSKYFPNRLLLSFRGVLAFPKLSRSGVASRICSVTRLFGARLTAARYCITNLVDSVFPEPDSPEMTTTWLALELLAAVTWLYAEEPTANKCLRKKCQNKIVDPFEYKLIVTRRNSIFMIFILKAIYVKYIYKIIK